jgi:hypothetical protein
VGGALGHLLEVSTSRRSTDGERVSIEYRDGWTVLA